MASRSPEGGVNRRWACLLELLEKEPRVVCALLEVTGLFRVKRHLPGTDRDDRGEADADRRPEQLELDRLERRAGCVAVEEEPSCHESICSSLPDDRRDPGGDVLQEGRMDDVAEVDDPDD